MLKYALFAWVRGKARGGWEDMASRHFTLVDALASIDNIRKVSPNANWDRHIVDLHQGGIVKHSEAE